MQHKFVDIKFFTYKTIPYNFHINSALLQHPNKENKIFLISFFTNSP